MRILKKAEQKNFRVDTFRHESIQILTWLSMGMIEFAGIEEHTGEKVYRVFTCNLKSVNVELDEQGMYTNVALTHENNKMYVII